MKYRILSLDGGGIKGLLTAVLLERIVAAFPQFIANVDLIAGTSTGGIIAISLASGLAPADVVDLYRNDGPAIFDASWVRNIKDLGDLTGAKYDNTNLHQILTRRFGAALTLGALRKKVVVPAFDLDNSQDPYYAAAVPAGSVMRTWRPKFFHNFPGPDSDGDQLAVDVAMRTSAAPTYFPSYQHYVDGGVVANNPSMAAVAQALDTGTGGQQLGDLRVLSLGTGAVSQYIGGGNLDWGLGQWAGNFVPMMMGGVAGVADYQCQRLLGQRYCRLDPELAANIAMDDVSQIPTLAQMAAAVDIGPIVAWLTQWW